MSDMAMKYKMKKRMENSSMPVRCEHGSTSCEVCHGGKMMAEGGETSTTGNKTKTGGSNPGGASTGGAGTVTITTGKNPPRSISVTDVGGNTEAHNGGGMDPGDEDDDMMAEGGDVSGDDDLVMKIMKKRYSQGGMVANDTKILADFQDAQYDDLVKDDELEFSYTGANSGDELGDKQEDDDRKDIVSRVMKSRRKKDKMPRPA